MKGKWMKIVRQYTIITLGISMMAVGVYFFKFPNNFVFGGVTGAAAKCWTAHGRHWLPS